MTLDPPWLEAVLDECALAPARASGPGGQHVNKTSTAVELRLDLAASQALPEEVKARLRDLAGARLSQEDILILFSQNHRSQELNRQDVKARLAGLLRLAAHRPKTRRPTRPTLSSKLKRLESKSRRAGVKGLRGRPRGED